MSDPPQTEGASPPSPVDVVVDALDRRVVGPADRSRLHKALDRADAPVRGRAGADAAVGRATEGVWR
jgi:hypothetical protein